MIVAIGNTFVVPIPRSMVVIGFLRSAPLNTVAPEFRDDVVQRLTNATGGWSALAVGLSGRVGLKLGALSEQVAIDAAMQDCAAKDRDCRITAIGPFLVEPRAAADTVQIPAAATGATASRPSAPLANPEPAPAQWMSAQSEQRATALVPELVPFISQSDQATIRDIYMSAPNYKALAVSSTTIGFVTSQPDKATAEKAAVANCRVIDRKHESTCELYASGNIVVANRARPPLPSEPWLVRDPSIETPFAAKDIPLLTPAYRRLFERGEYKNTISTKALALSPTGRYSHYGSDVGIDEAVRRALERCGYISGVACMIVAVDKTFVVPIPKSMRVTGFLRSAPLDTVAPESRDVVQRLTNATGGWNALAVGLTGRVGLKLGAPSEQTAIEGAIQDCAAQDRDCQIAAIGPFRVVPHVAENTTQTPTTGPSASASEPPG